MANKIQIRRGKKKDLPPLSVGEYALCTDTNEIYIGTEDGNIAAVPVSSVCGKKGDVTLSKDDVGLSAVDNTADSVKNVSTAAALASPRNIRVNLSTFSPASFDGSKDVEPGISGILSASNGGTGNSMGIADSAIKLETARRINGIPFNGLSDITIHDDTKFPSAGGVISGDVEMENNLLVKGDVEIKNAIVIGGHNEEYTIGKNASAQGFSVIASGDYSASRGYYSTASGEFSAAGGYNVRASARYSHADGYSASASGFFSRADGEEVEAKGCFEHAIGRYNVPSNTSSISYDVNGNAITVGNGVATGARSNAFRVTFAGQVYGSSAYNSSGADYAEYFEWLDGNPDNEERLGRFVTLEGDKIRYANEKDEFILGVIATNPSVVGNSDTGIWSGMWLRDKWGRFIYEENKKSSEYDCNLAAENAVETETSDIERSLVINPDYNPDMEFVSREHRPEWAAIGMLGQLYVYDDGSCEVNGYCRPNNEGIAAKADSGYRVIGKKDGLVRIIFR